MHRRYFVAAFLAKLIVGFLFFAQPAHARSIALSFDDGPHMADTVRMTAAERNSAILKQLADAKVKSVLFVSFTDKDEQRIALLRQWGNEGHLLGNHTATHPDFHDKQTTLETFEQDMLAGDAAIRTLPGYTRLFRFPYLKEGDTAAKRDGFREFLKSQSYRNGYVSVDMSDWYYSERLRDRLSKDPAADLSPYRDAYLRHVYERTEYYDELSRKVLHRSVLHVALMHHNLLNALFLRDVIRMLRNKGWEVIDAKVAFEDPVYRAGPNILPAGESILWALAKQNNVPGLRYPAEDDSYEKPILDGLGL
jgi:peptidoglycan/xylan/chitin deacetylase (PgdA/CDA1 family)